MIKTLGLRFNWENIVSDHVKLHFQMQTAYLYIIPNSG